MSDQSWFEVRRLQHHQQIKAHGQHMLNKHDGKGGKSSDVIWSKEQMEMSPQFV